MSIGALVLAALATPPDPRLVELRSALSEARSNLSAEVAAGRGTLAIPMIRKQIQNANMVWTVCLRFEVERLKATRRSTTTITQKALEGCIPDRDEIKAWFRLAMRATNRLDQEANLESEMARLEILQREGIARNLQLYPPK